MLSNFLGSSTGRKRWDARGSTLPTGGVSLFVRGGGQLPNNGTFAKGLNPLLANALAGVGGGFGLKGPGHAITRQGNANRVPNPNRANIGVVQRTAAANAARLQQNRLNIPVYGQMGGATFMAQNPLAQGNIFARPPVGAGQAAFTLGGIANNYQAGALNVRQGLVAGAMRQRPGRQRAYPPAPLQRFPPNRAAMAAANAQASLLPPQGAPKPVGDTLDHSRNRTVVQNNATVTGGQQPSGK